MNFEHHNVGAELDEDRLSSLPLDLIHQILSCFDTKFVVQTCLLLSPRWKPIWTSVPCLNFSSTEFKSLQKLAQFVTNVLSHRNHHVEVTCVKLNFHGAASQVFVREIATYAFSHNVQELIVDSNPKTCHELPPCLFSSKTLKHLTFTTCTLEHCLTPKTPWDFPALTTLYLDDISLCDDYRESLDLFSKCVNLQNLTLDFFEVNAKVFNIITPRLSYLRFSNNTKSIVFNVIAPQLENLIICNCYIKDLNIPSGISSFCYDGCSSPRWIKDRFHYVNKVAVSLSIYRPKKPYKQEYARGIINMLQQLRSAKFLTLNLDIVECISSFPELLSGQPSSFSNLIRLNIDSGSRDTCKLKMSTEARNFFLENSPNATFIMKLVIVVNLQELPTEAMKEKELKANMVSDIEDVMKGLQLSLEQENILIERNEAMDKKKVVIENLGLQSLILKKVKVGCLLDRLPKRQRKQIYARYSQQHEQVQALFDRQDSNYNFIRKIIDVFRSLASEDVSSSTHPLPSQTSSASSTIGLKKTDSGSYSLHLKYQPNAMRYEPPAQVSYFVTLTKFYTDHANLKMVAAKGRANLKIFVLVGLIKVLGRLLSLEL
ncbi:F-box/FBD/LRR-repeat protein At5g22660-like [Rutidosis leptorrhynchoides]|uniref:F-box/FBD/LRR-repeat protein At5g22660-like n=1 Tax=Rutidosis leptorrhynchoides TaxID=125765 RepID=UPI003A98E6A0